MRNYRQGREPSRHVLVPFDRREAISIEVAAGIAGFSAPHMRRLVAQYQLGRRVGVGAWKVSRVALQLFLDGSWPALRAYHDGNRDHPSIRAEFQRLGMIREVA